MEKLTFVAISGVSHNAPDNVDHANTTSPAQAATSINSYFSNDDDLVEFEDTHVHTPNVKGDFSSDEDILSICSRNSQAGFFYFSEQDSKQYSG